jgi:hypothetical protein
MKRLTNSFLLAAACTLPMISFGQKTVSPPSVGILTNYRYWPVQYVQFVGTELPYAMIELDVDSSGKQPLLYLTLTERASGKRIHYTNNDGLVAMAKAQSEEAHKTEMAFDPPDTENPGSISNVRLTMADGKPLQWRFVQGSDVSEQGSGLTPLPDTKIPVFAYREQGAVAGEGTALQIGDVVSTAAVWTEISHPPQFIGYRGAMTHDAHMLVFPAGNESWTVTSAPSSLAVSSTWELDGANGNHRTLRIDKVSGAHYTISSIDRFQPSVRFTLEASREGDAWSIESVRYAPARDGDKHYLTLQFAPALSATTTKSDVTLLAGKKTTLASGTITATETATDQSLALDFATPAWAHGKTMTEETTPSANGSRTVAHP